ncbi:hypothetical protein NDU88_005378 [Pleurodeles waltl]|uniref:Uncharacterized protein n=1 Tax=Pleurodeles waltl TaxID=8319 RepID=A0AAV7NV61_PLEWA|nr:hypothetical protein NDU88_005378 [Pleurodeles waltl]
MLSTSVLVVQRYFLAMGVGPPPTPPMARTLHRALKRPIRCTAARPGETTLQHPLQVPWGRTSCLAPCSSVLLPHRGCWALIDPASGSCSLSRPQCTWALLSDALQRVLRQASGRPPFHVLYKSPGALLRASFLIPQRYFLDVNAGPVSASPVARSLLRALSAHRRTVACSLLGQGGATPRCPLQVPRAVFRSSVLVHQHCFLVVGARPARYCRRTAHSAVPLAHTVALSDALQRVLCPSRGSPPFNVLYNSPGGAPRTLILVSQHYFLVVGARPAPSPLADRALHRTLSARGRLVQCAVAYFLPG